MADDLFKALADPTRRTLLDELAERSGQTLFELCARLAMKHRLSMSRQAISQHLAVLEAAGLVESRREGRYKFHDLNTAPLRRITERWPLPDPTGPRATEPHTTGPDATGPHATGPQVTAPQATEPQENAP
ncbi:transcriptional regulator [Streptomyces sp. SGAir0957]